MPRVAEAEVVAQNRRHEEGNEFIRVVSSPRVERLERSTRLDSGCFFRLLVSSNENEPAHLPCQERARKEACGCGRSGCAASFLQSLGRVDLPVLYFGDISVFNNDMSCVIFRPVDCVVYCIKKAYRRYSSTGMSR